MSGVARISPDVEAIARSWVLKLASGHATAADAAQAREWMDADPDHRRAFERARRLWHEASTVENAFRRERKPMSRVSQPLIAMAAAAAIAALIPVVLHLWVVAKAQYRSPLGEVTTVALPDGSEVVLDTFAAIRTDFSGNRRVVELLRGRAFFTVAHDTSRPFAVRVPDGEAVAVGTAYSVARNGDDAIVAVAEGRVRVASDKAQIEVAAGNEVEWSTQLPLTARAIDRELTFAWTTGRIVVNDQPLSDVVAEIDRYHLGIILVQDRADVHVSGQFDIRRSEQGLQALAQSQDLRVTHWTPWITVLSE